MSNSLAPQFPGQEPPSHQLGEAQSPTPQSKTNTLAIVAFISAFFVALAGVVMGHISLKQIKKTGEGGRNFALAAVIVGYVSLAVQLIVATVLIAVTVMYGSASVSVLSDSVGTQSEPTDVGGQPQSSDLGQLETRVTQMTNCEVVEKVIAGVSMEDDSYDEATGMWASDHEFFSDWGALMMIVDDAQRVALEEYLETLTRAGQPGDIAKAEAAFNVVDEAYTEHCG
ncbi:MAG: DUF4190 domain-containing protein [Leucobacter sp.]|nr:DUF4190 domain-containing protein [Leucobacter sp.]